jgi:hypothetical protein
MSSAQAELQSVLKPSWSQQERSLQRAQGQQLEQEEPGLPADGRRILEPRRLARLR